MRAIPAVYIDGKVDFTFSYPNYEGPVRILVIFPTERDEPPVEEDMEEVEMELAGCPG